MTTEQIIKALECCSGIAKCVDCPYTEVYECSKKSARDTIALIKSQAGQIAGLNTALETLRDVAKDYEHRNENLINENKYLRDSKWDEVNQAKELAISATVKKMQERLKDTMLNEKDFICISASELDQIAKEILEGEPS